MLPAFSYTVPAVSPGDLWQLGDHLLLCGDCTREEDVAQFRAYAIDAVITDPPYGEIQAEWDKEGNTGFIQHLHSLTTLAASVACFCSLPYGFSLQQEMERYGWKFRFDLVWEKKNAGFKTSPKLPLVAHEYLFVFSRKGYSSKSTHLQRA